MSFESLMDITNNVSSLGSLIAFIGINNLFGGEKTIFEGLVNEIWEVG